MKLHKYVCKCGCELMKAEHRKEDCHGCEWLTCDYEDDGKCNQEFGGCWILTCSACGSQVEQVPCVEP